MSVGSTKQILVCGSGTLVKSGTRNVVCSDGSNVGSETVFVLDASKAAMFEASFAEFDYVYAGALFAMSFSMVVGLYAVSRGFGTVLGFIRKG